MSGTGHDPGPDADAAPVVVVTGLPRSGTSLMMQVLEAAGVAPLQDGARPPDASNPRGYYELSAVRGTATDASWVADAGGRAVKVIHRLLAHLPPGHRYRVIVMRRPIREVIASQDRMLARLGEPTVGLDPERLTAVLGAQLEEAVALLDRRPELEWIAVEHGRLLADAEAECARVLRFVRSEASAAEVARIVDPALHRERQGGPSEPG